MITLSVFFAYQFSSAHIGKIQRERIYSDALESVNQELREAGHGIQLDWQYWQIQSGQALSEEIFSLIDRSDLLVIDLSDSNSNVLIELGYSIAQVRGAGKKLIVFVHDDVGRRSLPSDIQGMFVHAVNEQKLGRILASELMTKASSIVPVSRLIRGFWNPQYKDLDIVCPTLPEDRRSRHANDLEANYLKYLSFADLDTLFYLQDKVRLHFPHSKSASFRSDRYSDSIASTGLIVGGPVWNHIARSIQASLPLRFSDGGDGNDDPVEDFGANAGRVFLPVVSNGTLESDVSYLARIDMHDGTHTFLISGCRTYGVLAAAKAFFEESVAPHNIQLLQKLCGDADFVIAFRSRVINQRAIPTKLEESSILALYCRHANGSFIKVGAN